MQQAKREERPASWNDSRPGRRCIIASRWWNSAVNNLLTEIIPLFCSDLLLNRGDRAPVDLREMRSKAAEGLELRLQSSWRGNVKHHQGSRVDIPASLPLGEILRALERLLTPGTIT